MLFQYSKPLMARTIILIILVFALAWTTSPVSANNMKIGSEYGVEDRVISFWCSLRAAKDLGKEHSKVKAKRLGREFGTELIRIAQVPSCPDGSRPRFVNGQFICELRSPPIQPNATHCRTPFGICPIGYGNPKCGQPCFCPDAYGRLVDGFGVGRLCRGY